LLKSGFEAPGRKQLNQHFDFITKGNKNQGLNCYSPVVQTCQCPILKLHEVKKLLAQMSMVLIIEAQFIIFGFDFMDNLL